MHRLLENLFKRGSVRSRFDEIYDQAVQAATAKDFARAIELYEQALTLKPLHAEAHYKRGNALKAAGNPAAALASYDSAIKYNPSFGYAYCNRGAVQQSLGLYAAALTSYDTAIALSAVDARAHYNRALLMQDCARWDEALASYDQAIAIDDKFADAHYNRSLALLSHGSFDEAGAASNGDGKTPIDCRSGPSRNLNNRFGLGPTPSWASACCSTPKEVLVTHCSSAATQKCVPT